MYLEMKNEKQSEFNKLPLFFAYGHDQLRRELDKRGATVKDIYSVDIEKTFFKGELVYERK